MLQRSLFTLVGASLFVLACSDAGTEPSDPAASQEIDVSVATETTVPAAEPEVVSTGLEMALLDPEVRPQDNLWLHVNGKWIADAEIPADKAMWGSFATLRQETDEQVKALLDDLTKRDDIEHGTEAQKVRDLYLSVLNTDLIEELGTAPLQPYLDRVDAVASTDDYVDLMAEMGMEAITTPISYFIYVHPTDSKRYIPQIYQDGMGLPSREYYLEDGEEYERVRTAYLPFMSDMLKLFGEENSEARAQAVFEFEKKLAEISWTPVENRDVTKTNNILSLAELQELSPELDWSRWFTGLGIAQTKEIRVYQPSFFKELGTLISTTDLAVLKDYAKLRTIRNYARYMPEEIRTTHFAFVSGTLYGTEEEPQQWQRAVSEINGSLGEALGKVYVDEYFPPEAKARMDELVANLYKAFEMSVDELEWMSDETKSRAKEKLAKLGPMIGHPDKWEDYSALEITPDNLVGNLVASARWVHNHEVDRLGGPVDLEEWITNPQTVNAFQVPARNQVVFPAGFLQPPNFFMNGDDAVNYGAIGTTIGHEIGHAFDDQGRKYDADGNLNDWWTEEDAKAFEANAQKLVEQFNAYEPFEGVNVNGELTLGENIGDLTGLEIALKAYHLSLGGKEAPVIDGLTGDQRFFISYAQSNRLVMREALYRNLVASDPHSPNEYRVETVKNLDAFHEAFGTQEGDAMYLAPEKRISIW